MYNACINVLFFCFTCKRVGGYINLYVSSKSSSNFLFVYVFVFLLFILLLLLLLLFSVVICIFCSVFLTDFMLCVCIVFVSLFIVLVVSVFMREKKISFHLWLGICCVICFTILRFYDLQMLYAKRKQIIPMFLQSNCDNCDTLVVPNIFHDRLLC